MDKTKKYTEVSTSTTTGIYSFIIPWIKNNTEILDCGCATGFLAQYLTTTLNCNVSIVEINPENFQKVISNVADGCCEDLNTTKWYDYYNSKNKKFDYILFTEVLEHLLYPQDTIRNAIKLLKDDGKLIFSIPNICHNDVIIRMFNDEFNYTSLGLLDDTHIHFWGINNLSIFFNNLGLKITEMNGITFPTGTTEQKTPFVNKKLLEALKERQYGEIYQIVGICEKI
jgi:2-polyprenyl-3-methyl-5-hydroxy-6-metoxy-1,4-benzoquinol methylase